MDTATPAPATDAKALAFVQAYIETNFNAAEAAKRCFNVGSRNAKNPQHSAEAMGSRMLRNVEVRGLLAKHLQEQFADKAFVLERLVQLADGARSERDRLKALELIGRFRAMFTDRHEVEGIKLADAIAAVEKEAIRVDWDNPEPVTRKS